MAINPGEDLETTARREIKEETGFVVSLSKKIGTYTRSQTVKRVYEAHITAGDLQCHPEEVAEARWFTIEEIKGLGSITFGVRKSIEDYVNGRFNQDYQISEQP